MKINIEEIDDQIILHLDGRLDAASSPILEKKLTSLMGENNKIILDFSEVEYLSSAGMRLLLAATKQLKANKGVLVLFSINDDIMEIIKMAGFERILHICETEQEALQLS